MSATCIAGITYQHANELNTASAGTKTDDADDADPSPAGTQECYAGGHVAPEPTGAGATGQFDFERVLQDFVLLTFLVGAQPFALWLLHFASTGPSTASCV